jgi:P-type E1-E2 ATPase
VEQAANISDVVFDKTGTLTLGRPLITDMKITGDYDRGLLLGAAAALEAMSEHPIASAVVRRAEDEGIESLPEITDFRAFPGLGVSGLASVGSGDSRLDVLAGTRDFMEKNSVDTAPAADAAAMFEAEGKTVMWFAITGRVAALFAVSDAIRPEAGEAVQAIHDMGIRVTMLTGDNRATAEAVAQGLGLDGFEAGVLPEGKAAYIKRLQSEGRRVAMVGDGVNDAPALVQADVGIAMSGGTDIAMDAADIGLARADLTYVPGALGLVRATFRVIRQNLFWAFAYNILAIPIAAGILYPLWGVRLSPAVAAAAMAMSSVTVVSNALRLRYWKI